MAARHAASTIGGALVVDLEHPAGGSEWDRVTNVEWETGPVDFVTHAAGAALGPGDVQPVQVAVAVTESGEAGARLVAHEPLVVAAEAELLPCRRQQVGRDREVRVVTGAAVFARGAVHHRGPLDGLAHVVVARQAVAVAQETSAPDPHNTAAAAIVDRSLIVSSFPSPRA